MNCLDELEIERWMLGVSEMQEEKMVHLLRCDRCRDRFLALRAVHAPLSGGISSMPGETNTVSSFVEEQIITLYPLVWERGASPTYRLAAQGGQPDDEIEVFSFCDTDRNFVGRLLHNNQTRRLCFYLLTDPMEQVSGLKILLPETGLQGITDLQGLVDFGEHDAFTCSRIQLVAPLATLDLQPFEAATEQWSEKHLFTLKNSGEETIEINITRCIPQGKYIVSYQPSAHVLSIVAVTTQRAFEAAPQQGVAVMETEAPERLLKIHIY